ncbi:hypothetical protein SAMN05421790_1178 [Kroppenstedtia eburnea]|uniref:Uncharacterized protein n=1 Tax=Kroppenstedtia eburnea TaxID=714067 RepID=A0A1N7Q236_9BACL|nr:hypothetical protein SAMN05421790_1178 [Kroppenstedtia eburnea]
MDREKDRLMALAGRIRNGTGKEETPRIEGGEASWAT